ncbi:MAG: HAD hydrolase family protein [Streptococcus sp.]
MSKELQEVLLTAPKYGHEIIFATARSYRDCLSILEGELRKLTVVGLNGGEVFQDEHLVSQYTIPSPCSQERLLATVILIISLFY